MRIRRFRLAHTALVLAAILGFGATASAQDTRTPSPGEKSPRRFNWLGGRLTHRDLVLWLAGVEYGVPAGAAFNSRYFHRWGGGGRRSGAHYSNSAVPFMNCTRS